MQSQLEQLPEEIAQLGGAFALLRAEIGKAVIGQEAVIEAVNNGLLLSPEGREPERPPWQKSSPIPQAPALPRSMQP